MKGADFQESGDQSVEGAPDCVFGLGMLVMVLELGGVWMVLIGRKLPV